MTHANVDHCEDPPTCILLRSSAWGRGAGGVDLNLNRAFTLYQPGRRRRNPDLALERYFDHPTPARAFGAATHHPERSSFAAITTDTGVPLTSRAAQRDRPGTLLGHAGRERAHDFYHRANDGLDETRRGRLDALEQL